MEKTNAMRILDKNKIPYAAREYDASITDGEAVAAILNEPPEEVFKTLVTVSDKGEHLVFASARMRRARFKKGGAGGGRQVGFHDPTKGTRTAHGLRARRLFARGHEKALPHLCARKRPDVAANVCERGQGGQANAPFSRRPSYRRRRSIRGSDSRIKLFALLFF